MHRALRQVSKACTITRTLYFASSRQSSTLVRSSLLRNQPRNFALGLRTYSQEPSKPDQNQNEDTRTEERTANESGPSEEITSEMWLQVLETTAKAPWLNMYPSDHEDRLRQAHTLVLQIILYLGRHQPDLDMAQHYLLAFETAPVGPGTEIARARDAIAVITRAMANNLSTIPLNAPVRTKYASIFDILGALITLNDAHMTGEGGKVDKWGDYWGRAQPVILNLGEKLVDEGFGLSQAEQEELSRKA